MKLIIAIVNDEDVNKIINAFHENDLKITMMSSTGGFMKSGNSTLLSGVEDDKLEKAIKIIADIVKIKDESIKTHYDRFLPNKLKGKNINISIGGAIIFAINVERFEKL